MNKRPEKKITEILHDNSSQLGTLLKKVFQYNQLELKLEDFISPELASHVQLGAYQKGILILLADSGSWATKLNYQVPDLRSQLRQNPEWIGLKNILIKVAPHLAVNEAKKQAQMNPSVEHTIPISIASKEKLLETAHQLPDTPENEKLKEVLRRLAQP